MDRRAPEEVSEDVGHRGVDTQCGQRPRRTRELKARLFDVVVVQVYVAEGVYEFAGLQAASPSGG